MTELLFEFTEWIGTTFLVDFSLWISDTSLSLWIVNRLWAIPVIQTIHILTIAADLRHGAADEFARAGVVGNDRTIARTGQRYLPSVWCGLRRC